MKALVLLPQAIPSGVLLVLAWGFSRDSVCFHTPILQAQGCIHKRRLAGCSTDLQGKKNLKHLLKDLPSPELRAIEAVVVVII